MSSCLFFIQFLLPPIVAPVATREGGADTGRDGRRYLSFHVTYSSVTFVANSFEFVRLIIRDPLIPCQLFRRTTTRLRALRAFKGQLHSMRK